MSFNKQQNELTGELSEVRIGRAWSDSCDAGVVVIGVRESVLYTVAEEVRDAEDELKWLILKPAVVGTHNFPSMLLFND